MTIVLPVRPLLPEAVVRLHRRALSGGPGASAPRLVRLHQHGEMWQRPDGPALRFRAVQEIAVRAVAFRWRAWFPLGPLLPLPKVVVTDELDDGAGRLVARALGVLPVLRESGPAITEGQLLRYLAELPWAPHALVENHALQWRELADGSLEVGAACGGTHAAVRLELDETGIARASAPARPRLVGGVAVPTPWGGSFADYAVLGGIRVPTRARVWWDLPEGRFTYWRATVSVVELVA